MYSLTARSMSPLCMACSAARECVPIAAASAFCAVNDSASGAVRDNKIETQRTTTWRYELILVGRLAEGSIQRSSKILPHLQSLHSFTKERNRNSNLLVCFRQLTGQSIESCLYTLQPRSVILFQLGFSSGGRAPLPAQILGRSTPEQSPDELRFFLSHFPLRHTSSKLTGPTAPTRSSCAAAQFASAIRSRVTDAVASRRTISVTTGSRSGAVAAQVAGRPLPSSRRFRSLIRVFSCRLWTIPRRQGHRLDPPYHGPEESPREAVVNTTGGAAGGPAVIPGRSRPGCSLGRELRAPSHSQAQFRHFYHGLVAILEVEL